MKGAPVNEMKRLRSSNGRANRLTLASVRGDDAASVRTSTLMTTGQLRLRHGVWRQRSAAMTSHATEHFTGDASIAATPHHGRSTAAADLPAPSAKFCVSCLSRRACRVVSSRTRIARSWRNNCQRTATAAAAAHQPTPRQTSVTSYVLAN